ncbi:MAG: NifU family protein [Kiritimatiellae bacterium]|nr:NifU family protein [Kiritimatiellia bacterium]
MEEKIKQTLEQLRGMLQADGGDLQLVQIQGNNVTIRLRGACGACPFATQTLKQGIEQRLRREVDASINVIRVD